MGISAHPASECEFFSGWRMFNVERTFFAVHLRAFGAHRTLGQLGLGQVSHSLEIVVTGVAEMGRAEAEEHGDGATVSALVLQVVGAVFGAHLGPGHVAAAAANQFLGVEIVRLTDIAVANGFAAVISLFAFVTDVISVSVNCESRRVSFESGT